MNKPQIISDKNKKSLRIKKILTNKIEVNQFKKSNLVIVIGGDGFMLQTLKKNKSSKKQFYGINSGNYGFLMNIFSSKNIIKNLKKANMISISPLEMIVKNKNNKLKKSIAINVTIQSEEKTLNENDLDNINKLIISSVESKSGAKIRS